MNAPDVSVVVPVYNARDYVGAAIGSVLSQSISPDRVEIIAIDDGSTDGSAAVLAELAAQEPRLTVRTQPNSGTPGGGRNPGIDRARGRFVFFLDADDQLPPAALERMVDVALAEGSDVVLGRIGSVDGRRVPRGTFRRTVLDADLLRDRVFNTLGPTKLIRRALIDRLDLRFPEDQKVGEDQPFMAAVYLNAAKISILADADYYLTRHREDRGNITLTRQSAASHAETTFRVAAVIERYTQPGQLRDGLLSRPLGWSLPRALDGRWLKLAAAEQEELAARIRAHLAHLCTDGVRALLGVETRLRIDFLMAGDLDALGRYIELLTRTPAIPVAWEDGRFRQQLPAPLRDLVTAEQRETRPPEFSGRLEEVAVGGASVTVAVSLRAPRLQGLPGTVLLRLRRRGTEEHRDLEIRDQDRCAGPDAEAPPGAAAAPGAGSVLVRGRTGQLSRGVWDLYAVPRFEDGESSEHWEKELRVGAERSGTIPPEGASNLGEDPPPQDRLLAYFTKGHGNLSLDSGAVLHPDLALARASGLALDENARAVLLVETTRAPAAGDEYFGHLSGTAQLGGRHLLPAVRLGERMVGLRLPLDAGRTGASLRVTSVLGGAAAPLPITGIEFWPARAAGFDLRAADGGVEVLPVPGARPSGAGEAGLARGAGRARRLVETPVRRLAASPAGRRAARLPVLGPAARSVLRRWRRGGAGGAPHP